MQKVIKFLNDNKVWLTLIATFLTAVTSVGIQFKTDPNATQPQIVIVVPDSSSDQNLVLGTATPGKLEMIRIKVKAASELSKKEGVSFVKAFTAVSKVKDEDVVACAIKAGFPTQANGEIIKALFAWFLDPANQEKIKVFIEFVMERLKETSVTEVTEVSSFFIRSV